MHNTYFIYLFFIFFYCYLVSRPSLGMQRFINGCQALQYILSLTNNINNTNIYTIINNLFFHELYDKNIISIGIIQRNNIILNKNSLIYKLSNWFISFVQHILTNNSGLVYIPNQEIFINIPCQHFFINFVNSIIKFNLILR